MMAKIERLEQSIQAQLKGLLALVPQAHQAAPTVSKWSIGEHLEHCALALERTGQGFEIALMNGPSKVEGGPSLIGKIILLAGIIPRGKGKAPEAVKPKQLDGEAIRLALEKEQQRLAELKAKIPTLETSGWRLPHPIFGPLSPLQWLRFSEIHIRHHQKVIKDIQRAVPTAKA